MGSGDVYVHSNGPLKLHTQGSGTIHTTGQGCDPKKMDTLDRD